MTRNLNPQPKELWLNRALGKKNRRTTISLHQEDFDLLIGTAEFLQVGYGEVVRQSLRLYAIHVALSRR